LTIDNNGFAEFLLFAFYEDELEQSGRVEKHEKGYFVIAKSVKHC